MRQEIIILYSSLVEILMEDSRNESSILASKLSVLWIIGIKCLLTPLSFSIRSHLLPDMPMTIV
jgi:hypothetical protein